MAHKQYKPGQIVTLYGKKYRILRGKLYNFCSNCQYAALPINFYPCIWCVSHLRVNLSLQEIKPKHE